MKALIFISFLGILGLSTITYTSLAYVTGNYTFWSIVGVVSLIGMLILRIPVNEYMENHKD